MSIKNRFPIRVLGRNIPFLHLLRRVALVSMCFVLVFTLMMPMETKAWNLFGDGKIQPSVLPASKIDKLNAQAIGEVPTIRDENVKPKVDRRIDKEDIDKRKAFSKVFTNKDGTKTLRYSSNQQNYKQGDKWLEINNKLYPKLLEQQKSFLDIITLNEPQPVRSGEYTGNAGIIKVTMGSLRDGIKMTFADKTLTVVPEGAKAITPTEKDDRTVVYKDAWPNVDLEYELRGEIVKEKIILKNKHAQTEFNFKVNGGKLYTHPTRAGELAIEGVDPEQFSFSSLTLDVNQRGVISEERVAQAPTLNGIRATVDENWLGEQPDSAFPMIIDPSFYRYNDKGEMRKSDGYACNQTNCHFNTGTIYDGGWRHWRTYFNFDYSQAVGKNLLAANLQMPMAGGVGGETGNRQINVSWANCLSYHCVGIGAWGISQVGTWANINITEVLRPRLADSPGGAWFGIWGEEGAYKSYKPFYEMHIDVIYDSPTPVPTIVEPADKQATINTQPTLRINPVSDPDGAVQYNYIVSTNENGSGAVINSGWTNRTEWTIPDGILQDGTTYYWRVNAKDSHQYSQWSSTSIRSFKVDLRTGKDSTQSYDTVGPVGIDLATGNATLSESTHAMNALGGPIGLNLTYNTPAQAKHGLTGEYWNVSSTNIEPSGPPQMTRHDQDVNFSWPSGSSPGVGINADWFTARWKGYFVAPATGNYQFGASQDDAAVISVNGQNFSGCPGGPCFNGNPVSLTAGQVVPINIQFTEATGDGYFRLYVKGAVPEQIVPRDWLRAEVQPSVAQYGLTGRYYADDGGTRTFPQDPQDPNRLMMTRQDTKLSFDWGGAGPASGLRWDNFLVKWTGYITVPVSGSYTFGTQGDDGVRIKLNNGFMGAQQTVHDAWYYTPNRVWGTATNLTAGQAVPITIEYYEENYGASFNLFVKDANNVEQEMPVKWLTPKASALPNSWQMGINVDGNVGYERLRVAGQNVILEDSSRATHEYTWTGSGFKPPVNEDGQLTRNANNTYTLLDTDGRTYVFDSEGKLTSLTSATDDRNPANLRYEYSGDPSRLVKITDGVTNIRYGTLHYKNINEDGNCSVPAGFDAPVEGTLCAFKTSDGDVTKFYYKKVQDLNGNDIFHLSRVEKPGNELTDYGYDNIGRIVSSRDSIANDAIVAAVRTDDSSVLTEVVYDNLGRVHKIKAPAPRTSASRIEHMFDYLAGTQSYTGATVMHITGAPEPNGFSKRVEYDSLLRTTRETDLAGLSNLTEWDPVKDLQLSKTDPTGLKSTTVYDDDDRAIESYGPAPTAWYGTDRRPTATYTNQVPKTSTGYDETIVGPDVTYYNYKADNKTLVGVPKLRSNGFTDSSGNTTTPGVLEKIWGANKPITPDNGMNGWGLRATGKIRVPTTGTYSFHLWHDDGLRVYLDDTLLADDWNNGNNRRTDASRTLEAGKVYRIMIEYYDADNYGALGLYMSAPNAQPADGDKDWSLELKPGYNLKTSQTAHDSQLGDVMTTTTYNEPEYGQTDKTVLDPAGLNLQTTATYEAPNAAGSYLRQTSKTLPGGGTTTYQHYTATDTRDNPCTVGVESINQGGQPKGKIEADPDGAGPQVPRTSEAVYNHSGEVVATRYNDDAWTCTTYDDRGRVQQTIIPALGNKPGRTVTNDYAVGGNPLITTTSDSSGTVRVENDLLGRTVKYTDAKGKLTENTYDTYGKLTSRTSPIGTETYEYDTYDRLTVQKLDGVTFATVTYDQYSRISSVQYPAGMSLSSITRDTLGRENGTTYTLADSQTLSDQINRYVSGDIKDGTELGVSKSYQYDKAGRLTGATIGSNTYSYDFGAQDTSCTNYAAYDAGKNGNRTKLTVNGQSTIYCYDKADRLVSSSDATLTDAQYDAHGNTTSLGDTSHKTEFGYDASDRNTSIKSGTKETVFVRDAQGRILDREQRDNGILTSNVGYSFTGFDDAPGALLDGSGNVIQKYIRLPGNVLVAVKLNSQSAGATTYSLPNLHGDIMATVNADGALIDSHMTGPFGEALPNKAIPANTADGTTWNYVGQHQKLTDTDTSPISGGIVQMGARVYIPLLGRFLGVDPVEGGTDNDYVYANDPVGQFDLDGRAAQAIPALIAAIAFCTRYCPAILKTLQASLKNAQAAEKARKAEAAKKAAQEAARRSMLDRVMRDVRIDFGHGNRNNRTGLSKSQVSQAINSHLRANKNALRTNQSSVFKTRVGKVNLCYRAMIVRESFVNVGTFYKC